MSGKKTSTMTIQLPSEPMIGVFSTVRTSRVGFGSTSTRVQETIYYLVREMEDGSYETQPLNGDWLPMGFKAVITKDQLLQQYTPEPELYAKQVAPKLSELRKALAWGDKYRKQGNYFSAEMEYGKALKLDEDNIRATFGIGICCIERGEKEKADLVFQKLVSMDAAFDAEHKHLFNEFGIALRKGEMYDQAMSYYERAVALAPDDENLHFNIARAAYQKGDVRAVYRHVAQCLEINPGHEAALQVKAHLDRKVGANVGAVLQSPKAHGPTPQGVAQPAQPENAAQPKPTQEAAPSQGSSDAAANPVFQAGTAKGDSGANPYAPPKLTLRPRPDQQAKKQS